MEKEHDIRSLKWDKQSFCVSWYNATPPMKIMPEPSEASWSKYYNYRDKYVKWHYRGAIIQMQNVGSLQDKWLSFFNKNRKGKINYYRLKCLKIVQNVP